MNKRFIPTTNITAQIKDLVDQYNPNYGYMPDQPNFNYIDMELLEIIGQLTKELSAVEQRVYDLEHPNQDELTKLCIPKKQ